MDHLAKLYYNKAVALTEEIKVLEKKLKNLQEGGGAFDWSSAAMDRIRTQASMQTPSKPVEATTASVGTPTPDTPSVNQPTTGMGLPGVLTAAALIGAGIYGAKKMFGASKTGLTSKQASPLASPLPDIAPTGVAAEVSHIPSPFVDSKSGHVALSRQNHISKWGTPASQIKRPTIPTTMDFVNDITPNTTTAAQMVDAPAWGSKPSFQTAPATPEMPSFATPPGTPAKPVASKKTPTAVKNRTPPKDPGRTPDLWDNPTNAELKGGAAETPKVNFKGNPIAAEPPVTPAPVKAVNKLKGAEVNKSIAKTGVAKGSRLASGVGGIAGQIGASTMATDAVKQILGNDTDAEVAGAVASAASLKLAGPVGLAVGTGVALGKVIDAAVEDTGIGDIQRRKATKVAMAANKLLGNSGPSTKVEAMTSGVNTKREAAKARSVDPEKGFMNAKEAENFANTLSTPEARKKHMNDLTQAANAKLSLTGQALQNVGHNGDILDTVAPVIEKGTEIVGDAISTAAGFVGGAAKGVFNAIPGHENFTKGVEVLGGAAVSGRKAVRKAVKTIDKRNPLS